MKLFIITQAVDSAHPALGFFVKWINAFRKHPSISSVDVACFDHGSESLEDISVYRVKEANRRRRILAVWRLLRSSEWDVLFVHMTPIWCIVCWPIVLFRRKRMVLWYTHGSASFALRLACLLVDEIYTATADAFPFKSSRVFAVGHGISPTFEAAVRSDSNGCRYLAVGRRSRRKRVVETIELFARIRTLCPNAMFDWVGDNMDYAYEAEIQQTIKHLGLESSVRFPGPVDSPDMPSVFAGHDLLLHLSATGSLDKVAIEALASGCAIFSTNPATREGLGGQWFWDGSLNDLAASEAIKRAYNGVSPSERARIASRFNLVSLVDRLCKMMAKQVGNQG